MGLTKEKFYPIIETSMIIGLKIKNVRIGLGLTVEFLSAKLGVSRSYLTLIENGKRRLPKKLVEKLAKAFKLPKETIYNWYLEQEFKTLGVNKKYYDLIERVLKRHLKKKIASQKFLQTKQL